MQSNNKMIYLSLGSNLGNRRQYLQDALRLIELEIGQVLLMSSVYETAAWGKKDQGDFLNMTIGVKSILMPEDLLTAVLSIESKLGRQRIIKWGERCIDIDILFYDQEIIALAPRLIVPHPLLIFRKFVLVPLAEIAPYFIHPQFNKTIQSISEDLNDDSKISNTGNISI